MLFRNLALQEKEALFSRVWIRHFAVSDSIFLTGSPGDKMMIVLCGAVQIRVTSPKVGHTCWQHRLSVRCLEKSPCETAGRDKPTQS